MTKRILTALLCFSFSLLATAPNLTKPEWVALEMRILREAKRVQQLKQYEMEFASFCNQLGKKESNNDPTAINTFGCMGEWQFTVGTLRWLGYKNITPTAFRINPNIFPPELQKQALERLILLNLKGIQPYLGYIGKVINGVEITKAGLIAGMHLGGVGSVQKYLTSNGQVNAGDAYGTKISDYVREFSQFRI